MNLRRCTRYFIFILLFVIFGSCSQQNQEDKIKFIEDFEKKTYHIRTKCEYVGYYTIKAKDLDEAESIAQTKLLSEMNIEVDGSFDFSKFDPNESD